MSPGNSESQTWNSNNSYIDSNSNPDGIDFPIPGNDDARRSIDLYCSLIKETINFAKNEASIETPKKTKEDKNKTIAEIDREKLEKKISQKKNKLN